MSQMGKSKPSVLERSAPPREAVGVTVEPVLYGLCIVGSRAGLGVVGSFGDGHDVETTLSSSCQCLTWWSMGSRQQGFTSPSSSQFFSSGSKVSGSIPAYSES